MASDDEASQSSDSEDDDGDPVAPLMKYMMKYSNT